MHYLTTKEVLIKARELISKPENWIQGAVARNKYGVSTQAISPDAVCWCAVGALGAVACEYVIFNKTAHILEYAIQTQFPKVDGRPTTISIEEFNDYFATHEKILETFDRAIELADTE